MKKYFSLCTAFLVFAGILNFSSFATNKDISVKIDDKIVEFTDVKPIVENNRTFVPFRAIFEQMNANVSWDNDKQLITAQRGDTTVSFQIGKREMNIINNDEHKMKVIDVAPFIKNSRTYVPIRFASEALGACVDWEPQTRTVLIVDIDNLLKEYENKFKHIDNYLQFINKPYSLDGLLNLEMQYKTSMGNIPIIGNGTITGVSNPNGASFSGSILIDTETIKSSIIKNEGENAINSEIENIISSLSLASYQSILNNSENTLYLSDSVFSQLGLDENTWVGINLENIKNSLINSSKKSLLDYMANYGQNITLYSNPDNTVETVKKHLNSIAKIYSDEAFLITDDGGYSLSNDDGFSLVLNYDENNNLYCVKLENTVLNGNISCKLDLYTTNTDYNYSISIDGASVADIKLTLKASKSNTNQKPTLIPNGDVISIDIV